MSQTPRYTFLFPGQGTQTIGMGKSFYDSYQEARAIFQEADDLLQYSLSKKIFSGSEEHLTETQISQPAIFVTSIAILSALQKEFQLSSPSSVCGLSLGEYSALTSARYLSFSDALQLVIKRGKYMHEACDAIQGGMRVVLGLSDEIVEQAVLDISLPHDIWCANFNCPGQVVVSGTIEGLNRLEILLKERGAKRIIPLTVHGAFHSGLMKSAQNRLQEEIVHASITPTSIPVAMNVSGLFENNIDRIKMLLIDQVVSPVKWHRSIQSCIDHATDLFIEIGPGKTLAGMNKKSQRTQPTVSIETTNDLESLRIALEK